MVASAGRAKLFDCTVEATKNLGQVLDHYSRGDQEVAPVAPITADRKKVSRLGNTTLCALWMILATSIATNTRAPSRTNGLLD